MREITGIRLFKASLPPSTPLPTSQRRISHKFEIPASTGAASTPRPRDNLFWRHIRAKLSNTSGRLHGGQAIGLWHSLQVLADKALRRGGTNRHPLRLQGGCQWVFCRPAQAVLDMYLSHPIGLYRVWYSEQKRWAFRMPRPRPYRRIALSGRDRSLPSIWLPRYSFLFSGA